MVQDIGQQGGQYEETAEFRSVEQHMKFEVENSTCWGKS